jgi:hypothetical protein
MTKSRRMRWADYVAHMAEKRIVYKVLVRQSGGKTDGRNYTWETVLSSDSVTIDVK